MLDSIRVVIALCAAAALTGCVSAGDLLAQPPDRVVEHQASIDPAALAACVKADLILDRRSGKIEQLDSPDRTLLRIRTQAGSSATRRSPWHPSAIAHARAGDRYSPNHSASATMATSSRTRPALRPAKGAYS